MLKLCTWTEELNMNVYKKNGAESVIRWTEGKESDLFPKYHKKCYDLLEQINREPSFLKCYYSWFGMEVYIWSRNKAVINVLENTIFPMSKKIMDESFDVQGTAYHFPWQGIVMAEWISNGQTINQQCYVQVLEKLCEYVRTNCPGFLNCGRMG